MTMFVDADPLALSAVTAHSYTQAQGQTQTQTQAPAHAQGQERQPAQEQEPSPPSSHSPSDEVQSPIKPDGSPKKRKRTRKAATGKKFECKHKGCGKSYSRAEHLYRHQLNRTYSLAAHSCGTCFRACLWCLWSWLIDILTLTLTLS